jgi:subtilisin family serine protease
MIGKITLAAALAGAVFLGSLPAATPAIGGTFPISQQQIGGVTKSVNGVYIVIMERDPAVAYKGGITGHAPTRPGKGQKINPNSAHVKKYSGLLKQEQSKALRKVALDPTRVLHSYTIALNGFTAKMTLDQANALARTPGVRMVLPDEWRYRTTDSSPDFLGLTEPGGAYSKQFTGEGVVVGVIDDGIWPEHPSFADDGSYTPLPAYAGLPCEFGNTAHNPNDAPFTCNSKLLGARQMLATYRALIGADPDEYDSARDDNGHGTHTASTAAGNAGVAASLYGMPLGTISGIAPRARVIAYKGLGNLGGFTSDLAAAIDQAVADGVDVINYSIGGGAGGPGADEIAFLFAADAGVHVATSAGNSGPNPATLGNPGTMPWLTTVGASTQSRFFEGTITLGDGSVYTGASITPGLDTNLALVDAASAGGELCIPGTLNAAAVSGKIVLCKRGSVGRAAKSLAVSQAGGAGTILYNTVDTDNLSTDTHWTPTVQIDYTPGLAIKSYIASSPEPTARITTGDVSIWPYAPSMAIFSSRGPNPVAPDLIKPDITAPGFQILAGYSPTPDPGSTPPGELFAAIAGTSMSSPHVAGIFALMDQAHPDWSPAMVRSALMTTAHQNVLDNDRTSAADPFDMGAGHANAGGRWSKGSIAEPGLVYDAGLLDYQGFLCDMFPEVFANPAATCASLESAGIATKAYNLNYPSIAIAEVPGTKTVKRTVTSVAKENGNRTYDVSVEVPPGYAVTVHPATLSLKRGQTATYSMTVTNVSGPVGEWRFGSLTWRDRTGNYSAYSPIAVKAILFEAPAEIAGSGESGSASVNVAFGYTGSYTAAAHGLEPATVTSVNVLQDPDQSFNPSDGFSNRHQFSLSGAAFFRVALPPEATEADADLDIFVYNPSGQLVASSTKGGTDEQVDVLLPADGTWSVYVHGWSTPGGDSDYDMSTWVISATPGGNLGMDSAPNSATIGTVGQVNVSWGGATAGQWHLGAVSHTGASGLMGLTLVEVDNR